MVYIWYVLACIIKLIWSTSYLRFFSIYLTFFQYTCDFNQPCCSKLRRYVMGIKSQSHATHILSIKIFKIVIYNTSMQWIQLFCCWTLSIMIDDNLQFVDLITFLFDNLQELVMLAISLIRHYVIMLLLRYSDIGYSER